MKSSENPKTKHMFPMNDKSHGMVTRNSEKFKVQYANTDRKFGIIYMQNLLNEHKLKLT